MAGNPDTIYIYVYGVDSSVTPTITPTPEYFSNFSYGLNHWIASINYTYTFPMTISAEGYGSKTVNNYSVRSEMYVDVTLPPSHLYKWTNSTKNISYYTSTPTPTTNSFIYNATGDNVTNTYIYGGDTQAYFSSSNNTTMVYNIVWGSPAQTYSASLPIGGSYMAGGIIGKE